MVAQLETDVLVVGSGPAGATSAALLGLYGVRHVLITKYGWLADTPRAHITNQRAMEVLRDLDLEDAAVAQATAAAADGEQRVLRKPRGRRAGTAIFVGQSPRAQGRLRTREPDQHLRPAAKSARADPDRGRRAARHHAALQYGVHGSRAGR